MTAWPVARLALTAATALAVTAALSVMRAALRPHQEAAPRAAARDSLGRRVKQRLAKLGTRVRAAHWRRAQRTKVPVAMVATVARAATPTKASSKHVCCS